MSIPQSSTTPRPLVVVLFGGESSEHQISCATAGGVLRAIDRDKWNVVAIGIAPGGQWVPLPPDPAVYDLGGDSGYTVVPGEKRTALLPGTPRLIEYQVDGQGELVPDSLSVVGEVDVVFPLLHGPFGEDGTLQGLLELSHVNYVGCGVTSSAIAQEKHLTKTVLKDAGIDVGSWISFTKKEWEEQNEQCVEQIGELSYPVFVKPSRAGSSQGVAKVESQQELDIAVKQALVHDPKIIVEALLSGREVECGVLARADGSVVASSVGEIRVLKDGFYDYEAKYFSPDSVQLDCPADLPEEVAQQIQHLSLRAFRALECEGLARVDFFYDPNTGSVVLNEVNTLPGFTPFSMYPTMFKEAGLAYPQLVEALLAEAMGREAGLR